MIGDRHTFWLKTAVGSDDPIQLFPNWGYFERLIQPRSFNRTQSGILNSYTLVGSYEEYSLPVSIVNSQYSNILNSWWEAQTQLHYTVNDSVVPYDGHFILDDSYYGLLDQSYNPLIDYITYRNKLVRISNINKPFSINRENRYSDFDGIIFLVTVS